MYHCMFRWRESCFLYERPHDDSAGAGRTSQPLPWLLTEQGYVCTLALAIRKSEMRKRIPSLPLMLSCCGKRSFLVGRLSEKTRLQKRQGQGQKK
ncbi:hypothetical protein IF1G_05894 [Cordyceps javanica]|uniref:Uncharacterized protein n=1 Tax=Cordyceps javanica TaxID=43265 RepID=A0A545UZL6_9HYPO|nr:hypothetical protein IF1G_05894 [Cordyceps javanica]